jgi:hypothetical protein
MMFSASLVQGKAAADNVDSLGRRLFESYELPDGVQGTSPTRASVGGPTCELQAQDRARHIREQRSPRQTACLSIC